MTERRHTLYLIDGSGYIFRAFYALPALSTSRGVVTNATYGFTRMLLKLLKQAHPSHIAIAFDSPKKTFRDDLFADYKANRPPAPSALLGQIPYIYRVVEALRIKLLLLDGYEADDVLGTLALRAAGRGFDVIIVTADKDFMQLVGPHISLWDTMRDRRTTADDIRERFGIEPRDLIDVMALTGDAVDNVKGVPGVGEKTAIALVRRFGSLAELLKRLDELAASDFPNGKKLAAAIAENRSNLELARKLVRIDTNAPITVEPEELAFAGLEQIDRDALSALAQELEFHSLLRELAGDTPSKKQPESVTPSAAQQAIIEQMTKVHRLFVHLSDQDDQSKTLKLMGEGEDRLFCVLDAPSFEKAAALLENASLPKACHDAKSHYRRLAACGVKLAGVDFDTMLAGFLLDAERPEPALAALYQDHFAHDRKNGSSTASVASADAHLSGRPSEPEMVAALLPVLRKRMQEAGLTRLFEEVEMPLAAVLAAMEDVGIKVDAEALGRISDQFGRELTELETECHRLAGRRFNLNSPLQLRQVLFGELKLPVEGIKKTKSGLTTDSEALAKLAQHHPLPERVLRYRALAKLKSAYVDSLPTLIDPKSGRLHTTFHQALTATGRLSSSNPNLQNIPLRSEEGRRIRRAFVADTDKVLLSADYSQIELRVLAHLSGDQTLLAAFQRGEDIHVRTATEVLGLPAEAVDANARRLAKVINFGLLYGMGPQRLARELGIERRLAAEYIERYFERLSGVKSYLEATLRQARATGFVTTMYGRRRYLRELNSPAAEVRAQAERAALNTPVQGTAAELIKLAMVRLDGMLRESRRIARLLLQVHDELLLEVALTELKPVAKILKESMEGAAVLKVPLSVELKFGPNWADLEGLNLD
jgi:DNA polymerase-1